MDFGGFEFDPKTSSVSNMPKLSTKHHVNLDKSLDEVISDRRKERTPERAAPPKKTTDRKPATPKKPQTEKAPAEKKQLDKKGIIDLRVPQRVIRELLNHAGIDTQGYTIKLQAVPVKKQ